MTEITIHWVCPRCKATVPLQAYTEDDPQYDINIGMRRQIVHWASEACQKDAALAAGEATGQIP